MYKENVTYTDFDGNMRTETLHFNLTETELLEMQITTAGGLDTKLNEIIAANDQKSLMTLFKDLVLRAYGVKTPDGRRMIKNKAVRDEFTQTEAYNVFFMSLVTNAEKAVAFVKGIVPKELSYEAAQAATSAGPITVGSMDVSKISAPGLNTVNPVTGF